MTIKNAVEQFNTERKGHKFSRAEMINWLNEVDGFIKKEVIDTLENTGLEFNGYTENTSSDTVLLAEDPYSKIYIYYMCSQADRIDNETARFNNNTLLFDNLYGDYKRYMTRIHKDKFNLRMKYPI